jgi:outer membrane protein, heavy metal efflux system
VKNALPMSLPYRLPRRATLAIALAALAGCTVNPRKNFDQVQDDVYQRTGQRIVWNAGSPDDEKVQQTIRDLLTHELTVEQVVQVALLNNADLQAAYEDLGIAQADLVQAGLLVNPVISAEIRFPNRPHYPIEANLEEEFLQIFFLPLKKKIAEASFEQSKATVTGAVIRRASETRAAFYKLQGARQLLELRQTVLAAAQASLDAARRLRAAGNTRDLDLANEQALLAQARLELSQAEAEVAENREDLNLLMGLWGPEAATWNVTSRLPDPADTPLEGLESLAVAQRQDLLAARNATLVAARTAGFANVAAVFSGAMLGAHYQRDADVKPTIGPAITVPIPIFDQGQAASARALAQFHQAEDRYKSLAVQIRSQVRKTHYRMETARQRAAYYKDVVIPLRRRITDQTQLQYNGMFIGVIGLLSAKQEEINAGSRYVEALRDYWVARSELEAAVGGRLSQSAPTTAAALEPATTPAAPHSHAE